MGLFREITELKKIEEKLKKSEEKYKTLVENSNDFIFMIDKSRRVVSLNKATAGFLGRKEEDIIGRPIFSLFPERIAAEYSNNLRKVFKTGKNYTYESKLIMGKKEVWIATNLSPVKDSKGNIAEVIGLARDTTSRKKAEDALKESEEKYRKIVESSPDGIIIHSEDKIRFTNDAASKMMDAKSKDQLIGKSVIGFVSPESRKLAKNRIMKLIKKRGRTDRVEERLITLKGRTIDAETTGTLVTYNGKPAIQTFIHDVTNRKKAEKALKESHEIIKNSPVVVFLWKNAEGWPVELVSDNVKEVFGYTAEEFMSGKLAFEKVVYPKDFLKFSCRHPEYRRRRRPAL